MSQTNRLAGQPPPFDRLIDPRKFKFPAPSVSHPPSFSGSYYVVSVSSNPTGSGSGSASTVAHIDWTGVLAQDGRTPLVSLRLQRGAFLYHTVLSDLHLKPQFLSRPRISRRSSKVVTAIDSKWFSVYDQTTDINCLRARRFESCLRRFVEVDGDIFACWVEGMVFCRSGMGAWVEWAMHVRSTTFEMTVAAATISSFLRYYAGFVWISTLHIRIDKCTLRYTISTSLPRHVMILEQ